MMFKKGISALEVLIVIFIVSILATAIFASLKSFRSGQALNNGAIQTVNILRDAHSRTVSSLEGTQYGVHIDTNGITLFIGSTYTQGAQGNVVSAFQTGVDVQSVSLAGGGSDVVFKRISGDSDNYGTITLASTSDTNKTKIISISQHGIIESQ